MATLLKEVLKHQVYPAMGCTEPVSVALCAANAAALVKGKIKKAIIFTDTATFKNGLGVRIPNTKGEKGNLLAAAAGLILANPQSGMEILKQVTPAVLKQAKELVKNKNIDRTKWDQCIKSSAVTIKLRYIIFKSIVIFYFIICY